mmetsp:Transcript_8209/g.16238  ORF Transcript_8209/g.16238 Transcript_8209/m.16238 type:complete len:88 (+) Transcript_8209:531-794(+)
MHSVRAYLHILSVRVLAHLLVCACIFRVRANKSAWKMFVCACAPTFTWAWVCQMRLHINAHAVGLCVCMSCLQMRRACAYQLDADAS